MNSIDAASDWKNLLKGLSWQVPDVKGLTKEGTHTCFSPNRKLEMVNRTKEVHGYRSPHPLDFRLSAHIPDGRHGIIHLNDPRFLDALAKAITDKLPDLLDDAVKILEAEGLEAFRVAEEEIKNSQRRLEALRPEVQTQRGLL